LDIQLKDKESAITRLGIKNGRRSSFFIKPVYPEIIKWENELNSCKADSQA